MNVTLYQIAQADTISLDNLEKIDPFSFDLEIIQQRDFIYEKLAEWSFSEDPFAEIQHRIVGYMEEEKDLNDIFEPMRLLNKPSGTYISAFKDKSILDVKLLVKVFSTEKPVFPYSGADSLIEGCVGVILNQLRMKINNFAFTYAVFDCGVPIKKLNGTYQWCTRRGKKDYVISEYIEHGIELKRYIVHCTVEILMEILLQVACALRYAKIKLNFSHNDLWAKNVLIQKTKSKVKHNLYTPDGLKTISSDVLAVIIDFGFSSIDIDKRRIGIFHVPETEHLRDCQITEDFHYLIIDLYLKLKLAYPKELNIPRQGSTEEEVMENYKLRMKQYDENREKCLKLLETIYKYYSSDDLASSLRFASDVRKFRRLPQVKNEMEIFDQIINGMIDMKLVKVSN